MKSAAPDVDTVGRGVATSRSAASPKRANASSRLSVPFLSSRCIKLRTTAAFAKLSSFALLPWNMIHLPILIARRDDTLSHYALAFRLNQFRPCWQGRKQRNICLGMGPGLACTDSRDAVPPANFQN